MDIRRFERLCNERRLKAVKKIPVGKRIVVIADGYLNYHPECPKPHYQTIWAVGLDEEHLEVARPLYFEGVGKVSLEHRIAAAALDGIAMAEVMNGRLNRN